MIKVKEDQPLIDKIELVNENPRFISGYTLPFDSKDGVNIFQGYNGPLSHFATRRGTHNFVFDDRYSVDFKFPVGTPVLAAKDGIVESVFDSSGVYYDGIEIEEGLRSLPNLIALRHDDETYTLYSHLSKGIRLNLRDGVKQGQEIARTGLSGWIGPVPHLHFAAYKRNQPILKRIVRQTFPVKFSDYDGSLFDKDIRR